MYLPAPAQTHRYSVLITHIGNQKIPLMKVLVLIYRGIILPSNTDRTDPQNIRTIIDPTILTLLVSRPHRLSDNSQQGCFHILVGGVDMDPGKEKKSHRLVCLDLIHPSIIDDCGCSCTCKQKGKTCKRALNPCAGKKRKKNDVSRNRSSHLCKLKSCCRTGSDRIDRTR